MQDSASPPSPCPNSTAKRESSKTFPRRTSRANSQPGSRRTNVETILLLAHTEPDGSLARPALEALTTALALGGDVTVGLVGVATEAAAGQIATAGVARFLAVTGDAFGQPRYATDAAATEALCRAAGCALVIAPGTSRWSRALP